MSILGKSLTKSNGLNAVNRVLNLAQMCISRPRPASEYDSAGIFSDEDVLGIIDRMPLEENENQSL